MGVDAVREFNVVTDTYGVEDGKRPGGQVSIVTDSGSNEFHGTIYEFLRNSALDARNFFGQGLRQQLRVSAVRLVPDNAAPRESLVASTLELLTPSSPC